MPNRCGVFNCRGNYDEANKCRMFRLPKEEGEQQKLLAMLPPCKNFSPDPGKFHICEKHWSSDTPMIKIPGESTRPVLPPNIFDVPPSCLPTPKPCPRPAKQEDRQLEGFMKKDKISSFSQFLPEKKLNKKYDNIITYRTNDRLVCSFMAKNFQECKMTVIVENTPTLCSPLVLTAFKKGVRVPLSKILEPNNGLAYISQFFEAVHIAKCYVPSTKARILGMVEELQEMEFEDSKQTQKLQFITHQLNLLCQKRYSTQDFCFAVESFRHCSYDSLRDYLVLPNKRKVQAIISSVNLKEVLHKTFQKVNRPQQKTALLLVDEVKIRPTVAFSGGALSGMATNDPESKASSMLCVMVNSLHRGPSVMVSSTPVSTT